MNRIASASGLAVLCVFLLGIGSGDPAPIVVVVHHENPTEDLSLRGLRLLYGSYRQIWPGGQRVRLILPEAASPAMKLLVGRVFKATTEGEVLRYYRQAVFQQRISDEPVQLSSEAALRLVRKDKGAIALVERNAVGRGSSVKILRLSGQGMR